MARNTVAFSPVSIGPKGAARWIRACAAALLTLAVSGCETMERMDYFDRFFEAETARPNPPAADGRRQPTTVGAMDPRPNPSFPPAMESGQPPGGVVAMELRPNPPTSSTPNWAAEPGDVVSMEPRPNPPAQPAVAATTAQASRARVAEPRPDAAAQEPDAEARTRLLVRQNRWLTLFWMELTPAQQARVERQLRRGDVVLAAGDAEPAAAWDGMGLSDRAKLIFGAGQPPERPAPNYKRDGSTWAGTS